MVNSDLLATYLLAILGEQKWKTRMLPPLEIATPSDDDLVAVQELARSEGFIGEAWGQQIAEGMRSTSEDDLPQELTDEGRAKELAQFVAATWVTLIELAKRRGMTNLNADSLPISRQADLERAWNEGALQFGLTGQDFSDLVGEALERMSSRGDYVVP